MEPFLVFPNPAPVELARALDLGGYSWKAVATETEARLARPDHGWSAAVLVVDEALGDIASLSHSLREADSATPILLLVPGGRLDDLAENDNLFDDFCLTPFHPAELEARLRHLVAMSGTVRAARTDLVSYGALVLNLETYQALIDGHPLDLTYMEYELLKFLVQQPGRVFTRETLLSKVWGYEYYGGARTVDVHVRRLRAKLGEEHAGLISTVRSVGYRFGQSRWET